ncbi:MAG: hypothetical protein PHZ24_02750 [Bacteroidales bacterium]|nr:hypothetical protein [Bacteroidales bacterium]
MKIKCFPILIIVSFLLTNNTALAQRRSENMMDADKYLSKSLWSCSDKHFGYYFISYSVPVPLEKNIENAGLSHSLKLGYTYRYKIVDFFDIGAELAYTNRTSRIVKDSMHIFDPANFYDKIKTYQNSLGGSLYLRFNLGKQNHRSLGYFIDLGGFYNYNLWYGIQYVLKNSNIKQSARFKNSDYLDVQDYGAFVRLSKSYISIIVSYTPTDWINGFSSNNINYSRTPLMVGIQLNLYAK